MKPLAVLLCILLSASIVGCSREHNEGPAERMGRHVDNAVEDTEDSARRAAHNAKEAVEDTRDRLRANTND